MKRKLVLLALAALVTATLIVLLAWPKAGRRAQGPLQNDTYVWQRVWTEPVVEAIHEHGPRFNELVALKTEVVWRSGQPQVVAVPIDYAALKAAGRGVGLALRIGPFSGPFRAKDARALRLLQLAEDMITEASTNQLQVAELQIDFDCAESKLDGYRIWVEAIRRQVSPVPVTVTALPAWLDRRAFQALAAAADGFVLQVHSLARPKGANAPFRLCDTDAARQAVEKAGRLGVPFRVALPTYGYFTAFNKAGRFVGLSAEGPLLSWPDDVQVREVRSDAGEMARLMRGWMADRPEMLRGAIWYRLPVSGERLNWSWPTLSMAMAGNVPRPALRAEARHPGPALVEIDLINSGQADYSLPASVIIRWLEGRLVASDALRDFVAAEAGSNAVRFHTGGGTLRLPPAERRTIGWVRLDQEVEVQVELESKNH